jgi:large subunit ribosomal protein L21
MSLIIQSGARQYMVEPGQTIIVTQIEGEVGSVLPLTLVHATGEHSSVKKVFGQIIGHQRGEKVIVAKYKPKSNYRRRYGPRQEETVLLITTSETSTEPKKISVKKKVKAA